MPKTVEGAKTTGPADQSPSQTRSNLLTCMCQGALLVHARVVGGRVCLLTRIACFEAWILTHLVINGARAWQTCTVPSSCLASTCLVGWLCFGCVCHAHPWLQPRRVFEANACTKCLACELSSMAVAVFPHRYGE